MGKQNTLMYFWYYKCGGKQNDSLLLWSVLCAIVTNKPILLIKVCHHIHHCSLYTYFFLTNHVH